MTTEDHTTYQTRHDVAYRVRDRFTRAFWNVVWIRDGATMCIS